MLQFIYLFIFYSFIYFWPHWVFTAACGLSLAAASGGYSSLQCMGFSLQWLLLLQSTGHRHTGFSSCGSWALEHRLSSCGARAQLLRGTWNLPGPGIEPMSPALAGGFLTTVPPGKSPHATIQMNFEDIMLSEISQPKKRQILHDSNMRYLQ